MADRIPIVTQTPGTGAGGLCEMQATEQVGISFGGTGAKTAPQALTNLGAVSTTDFNNHINNASNPHGITIGQLGGVSLPAFNAHATNASNPHGISAFQIGAATQAGLNALSTTVTNNTGAIATNSTQITTNTGNISNNAAAITLNTNNLATHAADQNNPHGLDINALLSADQAAALTRMVNTEWQDDITISPNVGADTFQITHTLTWTKTLAAGTYIFTGHCSMNMNNVTRNQELRLTQSGTQIGNTFSRESTDEGGSQVVHGVTLFSLSTVHVPWWVKIVHPGGIPAPILLESRRNITGGSFHRVWDFTGKLELTG